MADSVQLSPEQKAAIQAFAAKYPNFDLRTFGGPSSYGTDAARLAKDPKAAAELRDFALLKQQLGPALSGAHFTAGGDVQKNMAWWKQALLAAGVVGAPFVLGAALPAAAATAPGAGVGIGETGATVGLGGLGAGAGTTAATVAPAVAAGAKAGLWSKIAVPLLTTGIQAGTNLAGTKMQVDAQKAAAELQAKAAEEALQWQKDVYQQRREDLAPAIGVGGGATRALGDLMGIPTPEGGYHAPPPPGTAPAVPAPAAPAPPAAAPAPSQTVQMRSPTGQVQAVPIAQVQHYQQLGAVVVQ